MGMTSLADEMAGTHGDELLYSSNDICSRYWHLVALESQSELSLHALKATHLFLAIHILLVMMVRSAS